MPPCRWLEERRSRRGQKPKRTNPKRRRESQSSAEKPSEIYIFLVASTSSSSQSSLLYLLKIAQAEKKRDFKLRTALALHSPKTRRAHPPSLFRHFLSSFLSLDLKATRMYHASESKPSCPKILPSPVPLTTSDLQPDLLPPPGSLLQPPCPPTLPPSRARPSSPSSLSMDSTSSRSLSAGE